MQPLTMEQQDRLCFLIGDWYINTKNNLVNYENKTHKLGFNKEILKEMICNDLLFHEALLKINIELIASENKKNELINTK